MSDMKISGFNHTTCRRNNLDFSCMILQHERAVDCSPVNNQLFD